VLSPQEAKAFELLAAAFPDIEIVDVKPPTRAELEWANRVDLARSLAPLAARAGYPRLRLSGCEAVMAGKPGWKVFVRNGRLDQLEQALERLKARLP